MPETPTPEERALLAALTQWAAQGWERFHFMEQHPDPCIITEIVMERYWNTYLAFVYFQGRHAGHFSFPASVWRGAPNLQEAKARVIDHWLNQPGGCAHWVYTWANSLEVLL